MFIHLSIDTHISPNYCYIPIYLLILAQIHVKDYKLDTPLYTMKKSEPCSKCGGNEIRGPFRKSIETGILIPSKSIFMKKVHPKIFICMKCGFVEEYISNDDLNNMNEWLPKAQLVELK